MTQTSKTIVILRKVAVVTILFHSGNSYAGEYIKGFSNKLTEDLYFEDNYDNTDKKANFNNTRSRTQLYSELKFVRNLFIKSQLKFEEVPQESEKQRRSALPNGGGDKTLENHGLFIEQLNAGYDDDKYNFKIGKFTANFGKAWKYIDDGIWIEDLPKEYRQNRKLGFEGGFNVGDKKKTGKYEFKLSTFTNDRKNLDNSIITIQDSPAKEDAKAGDTRSLASYVASLDVLFDFAKNEKLSYNFGYINLGVNKDASSIDREKIKDQKGFVAGMNYQYPLLERVSLNTLLEYVKMNNANGNSDIKDKYLTAAAVVELDKKYNLTVGLHNRNNVVKNADGFDQNFIEISTGYKFDKFCNSDTMLVQLGYKYTRKNSRSSLDEKNSLGMLLHYVKNF